MQIIVLGSSALVNLSVCLRALQEPGCLEKSIYAGNLRKHARTCTGVTCLLYTCSRSVLTFLFFSPQLILKAYLNLISLLLTEDAAGC